MPDDTPTWRSYAPAVLAWGFVSAVVLARLPRQPLANYGNNGAEWIEHADRLALGHALRAWFSEPYSLFELLRVLDGSFPPLLHLVSLPVPGGSVQSIVWTGVLWAGLLSAAVGVVASRLADRRTGVWAAAATALLPAVHGSAARYYYDLPLTALCWVATAALVCTWDRPLKSAWRWPAALAFAACLTKWTAVPFLGVLLIAAWMTLRSRPRLTVLATTLLVWALLCVTYLGVLGEDNSLAFMAAESGVVHSETDAAGNEVEGVGPVRAALRRIVDAEEPLWMRVVYYGAGWTLSTMSPLLAGALVLLLGVAAVRRTKGALFAGLVAAGHLGFLLLFVQPIDDRFLVTLTPALVIGAVTGLLALPRLAVPVGVALASIAALVAVDFHHGTESALTRPFSAQPLLMGRRPILQPPQGRGIGAASSTLWLGWSRSDETTPVRQGLRDAVWERLQACEPMQIAVVDEQPIIAPEGDASWLEYRASLSVQTRDEAPPLNVLGWDADMSMDGSPLRDRGVTCRDPAEEGTGPLDPDAIVLAAAEPDGSALPPLCPQDVSWRLEALVADPDGGPGVGFWSVGGRGCQR